MWPFKKKSKKLKTITTPVWEIKEVLLPVYNVTVIFSDGTLELFVLEPTIIENYDTCSAYYKYESFIESLKKEKFATILNTTIASDLVKRVNKQVYEEIYQIKVFVRDDITYEQE